MGNKRGILVGAAMGLVVGLAVFACTFIYAPVFPGWWDKLPATTSAVTYLGASPGCGGAVCVMTADGSSLQLTTSVPWRWLPGFSCLGGPHRLAELAEPCGSSSSAKCPRPGMTPPGTGPCDVSSEPFLATSFPPAGIRACLQSWGGFIDSYYLQVVALDSRGALWRYCVSETNAGRVASGVLQLGILAVICCPMAGIVLASWSLRNEAQERQ